MKIAIFGGSKELENNKKEIIREYLYKNLTKDDYIITGGTTGVMEFVSKIAQEIGTFVEAKVEDRWYEYLNEYNNKITRKKNSFQRMDETLSEVDEVWVFDGASGTLEELLETLNNTDIKVVIIGEKIKKFIAYLKQEFLIEDKYLKNVYMA